MCRFLVSAVCGVPSPCRDGNKSQVVTDDLVNELRISSANCLFLGSTVAADDKSILGGWAEKSAVTPRLAILGHRDTGASLFEIIYGK